MQSTTPKQFMRVRGEQLLNYAIKAFLGRFAEILVTLPRGEHAADLIQDPSLHYLSGGTTRTRSVAHALDRVTNPRVLVHDAARPFVTDEILDEVTLALDTHACSCPVIPVVNTIVRDEKGLLSDTPDRNLYREVQTPQGFDTAILREAITTFGEAHPHLPELVRRLGYPVKHVEGSPWLFKVTYAPSLHMATYYVENFMEIEPHGRE
jgi:2-C-methyl-D-erythritol 4-phosphate cytidylyltransferase